MKNPVLLIVFLVMLIFDTHAQNVSDIDENVYNTITIGTQVWMQENLKVTHYNNGDPIPEVTSQTEWDALSSGASSDYNNDVTNVSTYGRLYNWYAIADARKIAPEGWHVPTNSDWATLFDYLGGIAVAGNKLRETGNIHWDDYNGGDGNKYATNSSGFTALPAGFRIVGETFEYMTDFGFWWSATGSSADYADYLYMSITSASMESYLKSTGGSVRCVKDSPITDVTDLKNIDNIQVYPNPATDRVYISVSGTQFCKIKICDLTGDCIIRSELAEGVNLIDINSLPKGFYVISLISSDTTIQKKLIKQ